MYNSWHLSLLLFIAALWLLPQIQIQVIGYAYEHSEWNQER